MDFYAQNDPYAQNKPFGQNDPYSPPMKKQKSDENVYEDEVVILKEKVMIPVDKYPGFNFVGAIIGPSGSILKGLCKNTRSKIAVLGKGSMRDKNKEEELRASEEEEHAHLKEPLHVLIDIKAPRSEAHRRMSQALLEIYKFMVPPGQENQQHQQYFPPGPFGYRGDGFGGGAPLQGRGGPRGGRGGPPGGRGAPPHGTGRGRGRGGRLPRGGY